MSEIQKFYSGSSPLVSKTPEKALEDCPVTRTPAWLTWETQMESLTWSWHESWLLWPSVQWTRRSLLSVCLCLSLCNFTFQIKYICVDIFKNSKVVPWTCTIYSSNLMVGLWNVDGDMEIMPKWHWDWSPPGVWRKEERRTDKRQAWRMVWCFYSRPVACTECTS